MATALDTDRLAQLRAEHDEIVARNEEIRASINTLDELPEELITQLENDVARLDWIKGQIDGLSYVENIASLTQPDPKEAAMVSHGIPRRTSPHKPSRTYADPRCGFNQFGEFAQAVSRACSPQSQVDQRLASMAPTTYSNEGAGADGGYLVPPEFNARIMEYISEESSIYSRVTKTPVNHSLSWPVDENTPWGSTGPQAYFDGEGDQYTQSKVNLRTANITLSKLTCLCPVTDELLADASQLSTYLASAISKKLRWKVDFSILQGTGAGMPLGILSAPCLKSVAKEGSQTADTINSTNIFKMYNAMYGDFRGNAVWLYNQDCEVQLYTMVVAGTSSDVPVYLPASSPYSNLANAPNGSLFGRPVIPHQACETLGDHGDILFCDLSQYIVAHKTAAPQFDSSIHLYFDYGMTAVRATWRIAGMPLWSTTIAARDGSATYSPFVSLAARA